MPEQVPDKVKKERSIVIHNTSEKNKRIYRESFIGKKQTVLVEKIDNQGYATGYGENYVPVKFKADELTSHNNFREVIITGIETNEDPFIFADPIK